MAWQGGRAALVAPGPSRDMIPDLRARLAGYDVRIGIAEALLGMEPGELDALTLFDPKAIPKIQPALDRHLPYLKIFGTEQLRRFPGLDPVIVTFERELHAGSLGMALQLCRALGFASLDLFGVDLCWRGSERVQECKYAPSVMAELGQELYDSYSIEPAHYPGEDSLRSPHDLFTDQPFSKQARVVDRAYEEGAFEPMQILNWSPISQLRAIPIAPEALDFRPPRP